MDKQKYLADRKALVDQAEALLNEGKIDDYNAKVKEVQDLDAKWEAFALGQTNLNALKDKKINDQAIEKLLAGTEINGKTTAKTDPYATVEYREAFMEFCKTGAMPKDLQNIDTYTSTTDAGAMIPTTIMQEIIKEMKVYGQLFKRVRQTNLKGGVKYPILSLKPTAARITEAAPSSRQKAQANTSVEFGYYGMEVKIAISLLAEAVTLDMFESQFITLATEAMVKLIDYEIIKGDGDGEFLGITVDTRVAAGQKITLASADFATWEGWKKNVFAKIPLAYRAGGSFIMAAGTWDGYIDGMVDANGQPIARVNYGIADGSQERFGGREVILVEDYIIAQYDTANVGDVVAVFCKLSDFCVNSNMQMTVYRWLDHDNNQYVDKVILVNDGKLLDPKGVIIIKKGA